MPSRELAVGEGREGVGGGWLALGELGAGEVNGFGISVPSIRPMTAASGAPIGAEVSMLKLRGTEIQQRISELLMQAMGYYANPYMPEAMEYGWNEEPVGFAEAPPLAPAYFNTRKTSIYGGTNEIQKNIIAKMVLGL